MTAPDAMPERVLAYVSVFGTYSQIKDEYHDVECILVPEYRLLAAEARAKAMEDGPLDYMSGKCDRLKEQNAALRAERDALVPLARLGERALLASRDGHGMDGGDIQDRAVACGVVRAVPVDPTWDCQVQGACDCEPDGYCYRDTTATTHARAILAREVGK